jgi:hypothetical protein
MAFRHEHLQYILIQSCSHITILIHMQFIYTVLTKRNPWSRALPTRYETSAIHEWTTHAQQTRHEARVKCSYDARMSHRCCANFMRMLCECYADVVQMRRASYARHSSSKCDAKRAYTRHSSSKCDVKCAGCAHYTRCTRREKRASSMGYSYFWSVLYAGNSCE